MDFLLLKIILFNINASPTWNTASGNLGTISDYADVTHFTLSATDPEGGTVSYTESTSNLTGAGLALGSSNGQITGNPNDVSNNTTVSFAVNASDGTSTTNRAFNIEVVTPALDGSTSAKAALSAKAIRDLGITIDGAYYLKNANGDTYQAYCEMGVQGGGWELIWNTAGNGTLPLTQEVLLQDIKTTKNFLDKSNLYCWNTRNTLQYCNV